MLQRCHTLRVLVAGILGFTTLFFAHPATSQVLQWESRGQPDINGGGTGIAVKGDFAVASGETCDQLFDCTWYVRAHDRRTGATLWEDRLQNVVFFDLAKKVTIEDGRAFAAGWVYKAPEGYQFVARGYDLRTGTVLWDQRIDHGFGGDTAKVVCAHGDRVFVGGYFGPGPGKFDFVVVAFDAATGTVVWESEADNVSVAHSAAWDIQVIGGVVYAAGEYAGGMLIRAHDERTGTLLWERTVLYTRNYASPNSLVVSGGRLFLGATQVGPHFKIQAYDANSGALLWQNVLEDANNRASQATAVAAAGETVFAAGMADCNADTGVECKLLLRAYDAATGALLWQATNRSPGNDWTVYGALAADGEQVVVGGQALTKAGHYEGAFRVYDSRTGHLQWKDSFNGGGGPDAVDDVSEIALHGNHLFFTGQISRPDGGTDFLVRTYLAHPGKPD